MLVLALIALVLSSGVPFVLSTRHAPSVQSPTFATRNATDFARLPLAFEPNVGQTDASVRYMAHVPGGTLFFAPSEVVLTLSAHTAEGATGDTERGPGLAAPPPDSSSSAPGVLRVQFQGTSPGVHVVAADALAGRVNYLFGSDPAGWHTGIPTYQALTYYSLYPGIDLGYEGSGGRLKGTYVVAAGANPGLIRWSYEGADNVSLDRQGNLVVQMAGSGAIATEDAPLAWQERDGQRDPVEVSYLLHPDGTVGFAVGDYDHARPLVLDPTLTYSSFLGGTGFEEGFDIAVDAAGNTYVTGITESADFPTANAIQAANAGGFADAFVTKLNADGSALVYSTYLGGSSYDRANGIEVDGSGNVYITGDTASTDFPTFNAIQAANAGGTADAFVTKLNANGSALVYSTYLGGTAVDIGSDIAVDESGNVYITGDTSSTNFPISNAIQASNAGGTGDAFVTKLNAEGSALVYSTYLGGSGNDDSYGIEVDGSENVYVTGDTTSTNFPTVNPIQAANAGGIADAFVTKLNADGSALVYSTYLGGTGLETGSDIAVDATNNAHVVGFTTSTNFPTANALQSSNASGSDGFVVKLNPEGSAFVYSTYLGGNSSDGANGIVVDGDSNAYVTGYTYSNNFPTASALQNNNAGSSDLFVTKLNAQGSALVYSTYLGGGSLDEGHKIVVDGIGNAYVTGSTQSANFPTANAVQPAYAGEQDGFVAKIADSQALPTSTATAIATPTATATVCSVSFSDQHPDSSTFYSYVRCLACKGVVSGFSDGTFREGNPITRGQIAKMVSNAAGFDEDPGDQIYSDVAPGSPFYDYINRLTNRGIVAGYPCPTRPGGGDECTPENPGLFKPNENATRGQLAKIVSNAAALNEAVSGQHYADVPANGEGSQFYTWIMRLTNMNVMGGYACGTADPRSGPCDGENRPYFRPGNTVTRGQASKIVANTFFPDCQTP
ncbi:MAG: SBBP repeat-containing protein [Chloroflexota bacterium]|nr:SBBP repeat-containing protein [Chloroflexota bacterium]